MKSVLVGRVLVDKFDDVDLSAIWPSWAYSPEGRPDSGTVSKSPKIGDHKSTVVSSLASDADRPSVATRGNARNIVDFQDSSAIRLNVGKILGVFSGFVNHISMSWIRIGEEIPSIKERLALKLVLQCVLWSSGNVAMSWAVGLGIPMNMHASHRRHWKDGDQKE